MKALDPRRAAGAASAATAGRVTAAGASAAAPAGPSPDRASEPRPAAQAATAARALPPFDTASWQVASGEYVARVREALEDLIDLSDCSRRKIERILNAHGASLDLNRLLSGKFNLKLSQLLDVCRATGVHPIELLRLVLKEPPTPSPIIARMAALFGPGTPLPITRPAPASAAEPSEIHEIEHRLGALQREVAELRRRPPGTRAAIPNPSSERRP